MHRRPRSQQVFASAARTATPTAATISNHAVGGFFVIDVTAVTSTPSVVFTVKGVDPESDSVFTILASAAITSTGTTVLRVHPSLTASANTIAKDMLPEAIEVTAVHADSDSITYSMSYIACE